MSVEEEFAIAAVSRIASLFCRVLYPELAEQAGVNLLEK